MFLSAISYHKKWLVQKKCLLIVNFSCLLNDVERLNVERLKLWTESHHLHPHNCISRTGSKAPSTLRIESSASEFKNVEMKIPEAESVGLVLHPSSDLRTHIGLYWIRDFYIFLSNGPYFWLKHHGFYLQREKEDVL